MIESEIGYVCYVQGEGMPKFFHADFEAAWKEAARLASVAPTRNVYVLAPVFKVEASMKDVEPKVKKQPDVKPVVTVRKKRLLKIPE